MSGQDGLLLSEEQLWAAFRDAHKCFQVRIFQIFQWVKPFIIIILGGTWSRPTRGGPRRPKQDTDTDDWGEYENIGRHASWFWKYEKLGVLLSEYKETWNALWFWERFKNIGRCVLIWERFQDNANWYASYICRYDNTRLQSYQFQFDLKYLECMRLNVANMKDTQKYLKIFVDGACQNWQTFKDTCCYKCSRIFFVTNIWGYWLSQISKDAFCHKYLRILVVTNIWGYWLVQIFEDIGCHKYLRIFFVTNIELLWKLLNRCGIFKHADPSLNLHRNFWL